MGDVWLMLCAAAAMLSALPALKRLDAYMDARLERETAEAERDAQAAEDFARVDRED